AKGKVQVQAQSDAMELTADKDVTITSCKERIVVNAKQEILLTSGGAYIRLKGGNIEIHCPGTVTVKGASHNLSGPDSMHISSPLLPQSEYQNKHSLRFSIAHSDELMKDMGLVGKKFQITNELGNVLSSGTVPKDGRLPRIMTDEKSHLTLTIGEKKWHEQEVPYPKNDDISEELANYDDDETEENIGIENMPYMTQTNENSIPILPKEIIKKIINS
ncbi:DUF2345 domain-containing protein, partial [uncultured Aquitalea sp.]